MDARIGRRQFLGLAALSAAGVALRPAPPAGGAEGLGLARVAATWIGVYSEPSFRARRLDQLVRDEIITLTSQVNSDEGPSHNPVWFQLSDGYAHSGNLQRVRWLPQPPETLLPSAGALFEMSVPYTRTHRDPDPGSDPLYRLYYQSTHWVESSVVGADGRTWYRIIDDILYVRYYAPAEHLRRVTPEEMAPISPDLAAREKKIEVSLARQELRAYESGQLIFRTRISSGIPDTRPKENGVPTITPDGVFHVSKKTPMRHMGDGHITPDLEAYELPGVPWVSFFHETGVAFHGTYWHTDFGTPRSHGCVNMRPEEAKWLYRWTTPLASVSERLRGGHGTTVIVT
ncbi:MAG TPA: L,D-transpeptidase [Anaerolineales bacterium]|nr:L,D-transpeptidase [Anaerolineales bacterium]